MIFLRTLVFFLTLYISVDAFSQTKKDSILLFSDLNFRSEKEQDLFESYIEKGDSSKLLDLFLISIDKTNSSNVKDVSDKISQCVLYINDKYSSSKSNSKKVKQVYDYVHKTFLKVYKLNNSFSDVFVSGEYNCVSASALYAMIFSQTGISYAIKEKPTHVYLYAYPNDEKILIETTSPNFGYYQFNSQFVGKYVDALYASKQISKQEYESSTADELFNKYFFSDKDISIRQLLGLQFFNYGVFCSDKKLYAEALEWFKKSYIVYPSRSVFYVMQNALYEQLNNNNKYASFYEVKDFVLLMRYAEQGQEEALKTSVVDEFIRIKNTQLINANDIELFRRSYQFIAKECKDTSIKKDIDYVYWYEMSRVALISGRTDSIDTYLSNAYAVRPNNVDLRSLITHRVLGKISNYSDAKKVFEELELSIANYPFLLEHKDVRTVLSSCYLEMAYQAFRSQKSIQGENYLKSFESTMQDNTYYNINERYVEKSYSEACAYYYRKGDRQRAKSVIQRGLKFAPDNFGLKQRLAQIY